MLTFFSDLDLSSICAVTGRSEWPDWIYFHGKLMPSQGEFFFWGGGGGWGVHTQDLVIFPAFEIRVICAFLAEAQLY